VAHGTVVRLDLLDKAAQCGWEIEHTSGFDEFKRRGVTISATYSPEDEVLRVVRSGDAATEEMLDHDAPNRSEVLRVWLKGQVQQAIIAANIVALPAKGKKLKWNPGKGKPLLQRADGAEYSIATGHRGTYEWVIKDGLHAAYHYPGGVHTESPVVLVAPQSNWKVAYSACVGHNKAG
jgi:hypothetical protein